MPARLSVRRRWSTSDLVAPQHPSQRVARLGNLSPLHPADRILRRPEAVLRVTRSLEHAEDGCAEMVEALRGECLPLLLRREELVEPVGEGASGRRAEIERAQLAEVLLEERAKIVVRVAAPGPASSWRSEVIPKLPEPAQPA